MEIKKTSRFELQLLFEVKRCVQWDPCEKVVILWHDSWTVRERTVRESASAA